MPKFNKQEDDKVIEKNQTSAPGLYLSAGEIEHGDYDQKDWGELIQDYTNMRNGDPVLSTTIDFVKYPMMSSEWEVEPGSDTEQAREAVELVKWTFANIDKGFDNLLYHKLLALDFGVSMHEVIVKKADRAPNGKLVNRIVKLAPIMPETVDQFKYNNASYDLEGIVIDRRNVDSGSELVNIESDKLHIFTFQEEFDDVRGKSLYRKARLAWDSKQKILIAKVRGTQRGAGIPVIYTQGKPSASDQNKISQIGRTISMMNNGYVSMDEEKMRVELLQPQSQNDVMDLLDFLNREMFFNTLTEFLTSGIGSNGSRASTSEHKTAFELSVNFVMKQLEINIQDLVNKIINMSYLANINVEDRPVFKFSRIGEVDLSSVATNLKTLVEAGLRLGPEDGEFIREVFGLPSKTKEQVQIVDETENELSKKLEVVDDREYKPHEFMLEKANERLQDMKDRVETTLESVMSKVLLDIAEQVKHDKDADFEIRFKRELISKMDRNYDELFDGGIDDVTKEFEKASGTTSAITAKGRRRKKKKIELSVNKLLSDVQFVVADKLSSVSDTFIRNKGGIRSFMLGFLSKFKGSKRKVFTEVEAGYTDGRGDQLRQLDVKTYFYSARLDKNLCDECAPFDGLVLTERERIDLGLNLTNPVNPDCLGLLGPNTCRCVLIPRRDS